MVAPLASHAVAGILRSPALQDLPGLIHGFTTRALGACARGGGQLLPVLARDAGTWFVHDLEQVHGVQVHRVPPRTDAAGDGLVTAAPGSLLVVRTADCVPVLLAAVDGGAVVAVGAAHAGWRGLVAGILPRSVAGLRELAPDATIVAAMGPCIGPCCFEVGPDVAEALGARCGEALRPGDGDRSFADLGAAVGSELASLGASMPDGVSPPCTRCQADLFFSYRREGEASGRMAAFIGIRRRT